MKDVRVLCRPEVAPGFRLTGLPVVVADDVDAARERLAELRAEGLAGVVLVQDALFDDLPWVDGPPLVVLFPSPGWREEAPEERMIELLRRAVGYRVRL